MVYFMVIEIRLFGALKKFAEAGLLLLDVPQTCSIREIRELLKHRLSSEFPGVFKGELVDKAAFANEAGVFGEARVLGSDEQVAQTASLALLPPVCGG